MHHLPQPHDATLMDPFFHPSHRGRGFLGTTRRVERMTSRTPSTSRCLTYSLRRLH